MDPVSLTKLPIKPSEQEHGPRHAVDDLQHLCEMLYPEQGNGGQPGVFCFESRLPAVAGSDQHSIAARLLRQAHQLDGMEQ